MNLRKHQAFTLLELAIVLIILGILSSLVIFTWDDSAIKLSAQAERLKTDIRYIQMLSMAEHNTYQINFSANQYSLTESDGVTPVYFPASNSNSYSYEANISASASVTQLLFNSFGVPYINSVNTLDTNATVVLTNSTNNTTRTLTIRPETGYVSID